MVKKYGEGNWLKSIINDQIYLNTDLIAKKNLELDHNPKDWKVDPKTQPEEAQKIAAFVSKQFEVAQRSRQEMELEWGLATAFFEGRHAGL